MIMLAGNVICLCIQNKGLKKVGLGENLSVLVPIVLVNFKSIHSSSNLKKKLLMI